MNKIPVIINNRDLLTWPKKMIEKIKKLDNVGDIIIIDNGSTYEPLIDWYNTKPCDIVFTSNKGHTAPWTSKTIDSLNNDLYVVTDPDLGIDEIPNDTLVYLKDKLNEFNLKKIGLGLKYELTPIDSPYFNHIFNYEKKRVRNSRLENNVYLDVPMDTTFALYNKKEYFIGGASTGGEYRAKHYPWYLTNEERNHNKEFMYYINNANNSSSYKTFLNL